MFGISSCGVVDVTITATVGIDVVLGEGVGGREGLSCTRSQGCNGCVQASERVRDNNIGESLVACIGDGDVVVDLIACFIGNAITCWINRGDGLGDAQQWVLNNRNFL